MEDNAFLNIDYKIVKSIDITIKKVKGSKHFFISEHNLYTFTFVENGELKKIKGILKNINVGDKYVILTVDCSSEYNSSVYEVILNNIRDIEEHSVVTTLPDEYPIEEEDTPTTLPSMI